MTAPAMFDLAGRRALITGASRGIGFALAEGLAAAGAAIVVNGRSRSALDAAAGKLRERGASVDILPFDVTDAAAARDAIDRFEAGTGPLDILVNNAGMQHRGPLEEFPVEAFDRLMRTNVNSVFYVAQAVARHMIGRKRGRIVNIASVASALARPTVAPYTASKGAVAQITKGMAADWARHGIQVNAIAPGYFRTELNTALSSDPEFSAWVERRTPQGRWGELAELQGACIFLCSEAASFVNGHVLYVDGGISVTL
jgi:gluconate 5-dehydrogenase